jgi:hypothetical protein
VPNHASSSLVNQILIETKEILLNSKPRKFSEFSFEIHLNLEKFLWRKLFFSSNPSQPYFILIFWAHKGSFWIGQNLKVFEFGLNSFEIRFQIESTAVALHYGSRAHTSVTPSSRVSDWSRASMWLKRESVVPNPSPFSLHVTPLYTGPPLHCSAAAPL